MADDLIPVSVLLLLVAWTWLSYAITRWAHGWGFWRWTRSKDHAKPRLNFDKIPAQHGWRRLNHGVKPNEPANYR